MKYVYCSLEFSIDSNLCDYHLCRTGREEAVFIHSGSCSWFVLHVYYK